MQAAKLTLTVLLVLATAEGCRGKSPSASTAASSAPSGASAFVPWPFSRRPSVAGDGEIGAAAPTTQVRADAGARWAVLCQARTDTNGDGRLSVTLGRHGEQMGDRLATWLVIGEGAGEPIDDLLGESDDGRLVAVSRGGTTLVLDFEAARAFAVPALRDVEYSASEVFAVRSPGDKTVLERYDLATGVPQVIGHGSGLVSQFAEPPKGGWLALAAVPRDTNGDGAIELGDVRSMHSWDCGNAAAPSRRGKSERKGDASVRRLVRADGTKVVENAHGLLPFGDALLENPIGQAALVVRDGQRTAIAPADCRPVVLHADPKRGVVLIACGGGVDASHALLWSPSGTRRLELKVFGMERTKPGQRWVAVGSMEKRDGIVDLDARTMRTLELDERPLAIVERHALLAHKGELSWIDLQSGQRRSLSAATGGSLEASHPPFVAVGGVVVNVDQGKVLGRYSGRAEAVDGSGRVLLPAAREGFGPDSGPFRWQRPSAEGSN